MPAEPIKLVYSSYRPLDSYPEIKFQEWAQTIMEETEGRVQIEIVGNEELGKAVDHMDMVINGVCDIAAPMPTYTPGRFPLHDIQGIPMLMPSAEVAGRVYNELFNKYCLETEMKDIKLLFVFTLSPIQFTSTKPIKTLEDMKGLKFNAAAGGLQPKMLEAIGCEVVDLPGATKKYGYIKEGKLDVTPYTWLGILEFKLHEVTKYRTKVDYQTKCYLCAMNLKKWNSLPPDIQKIINKHTGPDISAKNGKGLDAEQAAARVELEAYDKKVGNPPIYDMPQSERKRFIEAFEPVTKQWVEELEAKGLPGKQYYAECLKLVEKYSKK